MKEMSEGNIPKMTMLFCYFGSWQQSIIIWGKGIFKDKSDEFGFEYEKVEIPIENSK